MNKIMIVVLFLYRGSVKNFNQYYYGEFRSHFRYPWPDKSLVVCIGDMNIVDQEDCVTVQWKMASATGFTAWTLHTTLFSFFVQFDVIRDLIFDVMHTLHLVVVKRRLELYKEKGFLAVAVEKRLDAMLSSAGQLKYCMVCMLLLYIELET